MPAHPHQPAPTFPDWSTGPAKTAAAILLVLAGGLGLVSTFGREHSRAGVSPAAAGPGPGAPAAAALVSARIDLNTATRAEFESLPGIGPTLARRIIDHRGTRGPFRTVEELDRVSGIGPVTMERLRPFVTVSGENGSEVQSPVPSSR